jgi:hypothetical protein
MNKYKIHNLPHSSCIIIIYYRSNFKVLFAFIEINKINSFFLNQALKRVLILIKFIF